MPGPSCMWVYVLGVILSDRDIKALIAWDQIRVIPLPPPSAYQPASLEVHLAEGVWLAACGRDDFRLSHTVETVTLPSHFCAQLNGKSSLGRLGLLVHATAGFIDPGFSGQITLELKNLSSRPLQLVEGMPIAQLVFHGLSSPAERPYGHPELGSHYQGQAGTTKSYMDPSAG